VKKDTEGLLVKGVSNEKVSASRTDLEITKSSGSLHRMEDSQNVLLKQLLQNTTCTTTSGSSNSTQTASFPNVPSLEDQLARPVPPTPSSLIPPLLDDIPMLKSTNTKQILSRETSFLSHSIKSQSSTNVEELTKTSAINSPLLTTLTKPTIESFEKQVKAAPIISQTSQQPNILAQKQTSLATIPLVPSEKSVTHQETAILQAQIKTNVETTLSNVIQVQQSQQQQQQQLRISTAVSGARIQVEQEHKKQLPPPSPLSLPPSQTQPQEVVIGLKASNTDEIRDVTLSPNSQQSNIATVPVSHPKSVSPTIQKSPSVLGNSITSTIGEPTKTPEQINTVQPLVPQTASVAQTLSRQAQLPQGTTAQHTVPLTEVKKEIFDDVLSSGNSIQLTDTKDFLSAKEELVDGAIDDKTGIYYFYRE
jgi:hypothetical protein